MSNGQESAGASRLMTPEQQAKMKSFGKKNGVPPEKIQSHLSDVGTAQAAAPKVLTRTPASLQAQAKQQAQQQTPQVPQVPQPQQVSQQPIVEENTQVKEPQIGSYDTYFEYLDENGGNLEIDLVTFREKGVETRYLALIFSGVDVRKDPPVTQEAFLNIESRESFEEIKAFFAQLEWED